MVKTLAESGLVNYEPYAGVTLTRAGRRLAALVLRRHRLVELFLVRVMGLRWDEVHDEAELLEHVVSDRLIDRIDEMLGRPEADPHGDPIPDAEGVVKKQQAQTLLTCPVGTRVTVTRIIDQDKPFLRFVENNDLKPGESIEVEQRDEAADSVRLRGKDDRRITIGARAASKLLVQVARAILLLLVVSSAARAQAARPFEIIDKSLLVEEALNQETGNQFSCTLRPRTRGHRAFGSCLSLARISVQTVATNRVMMSASLDESVATHASPIDALSSAASVNPYATRQQRAAALLAVS
jgi:DtxR family Mn-dependent transcriptional regulator